MFRKTTIFAVLATVLMFGMAASTPVAASDGSLAVDVSQADSGEVVVSVTHNGSAVSGAPVSVETINETTYDGTGEYTSDDNGTVTLPAPNETTEIRVTAEAENETATATATIEPASSDDGNESDGNETDAFGQEVSSFVHQLQNGDDNTTNSSDAPLGVLVANFVLENNPGNPPEHAGPPEWLTNDSKDKDTGPPEHAGPPEDKGNDEDKDRGPPEDKGNDKDRGPPEDRGPPGDDDGDDDDDEEE